MQRLTEEEFRQFQCERAMFVRKCLTRALEACDERVQRTETEGPTEEWCPFAETDHGADTRRAIESALEYAERLAGELLLAAYDAGNAEGREP